MSIVRGQSTAQEAVLLGCFRTRLMKDKRVGLFLEGFGVFQIVSVHDLYFLANVRKRDDAIHECSENDAMVCERTVCDISSSEIVCNLDCRYPTRRRGREVEDPHDEVGRPAALVEWGCDIRMVLQGATVHVQVFSLK